jgi:hypothetical protein
LVKVPFAIVSRMKKLWLSVLLAAFALNAVADPQLTAWLTNYSGQYARVYTTTARRTSGTSSTTWTNQSVVAYADVAQILYSANWVYVRYPDLPSHVIGPWLNPQGAVGSLWPANQKNIAKFPRSPSFPSKKTSTGTGYSGNWVNGVAAFNSLDGKAWNGSALVNSPHTRYTNYWHQNAPVGEDYNFDYAFITRTRTPLACATNSATTSRLILPRNFIPKTPAPTTRTHPFLVSPTTVIPSTVRMATAQPRTPAARCGA